MRNWFLRWFDIEDENLPNANGLSGVVHFISDPKIENGTIEIFVDFGSAPTTALAEFLDELLKLGIKICQIGKHCDPALFLAKE